MKQLVVKRKITSRTYDEFCFPLRNIPSNVPILKSRGDRPLKMTFENQLDALIWFHLQEHDSARHLIFDLNENSFAKECIAPAGGISRSSFSEAINNRGLEQLQYVFRELSQQARTVLPVDLMAIYCRKNFNEKVSLQNIRLIYSKIQNELMATERNIGRTRGLSSTIPSRIPTGNSYAKH